MPARLTIGLLLPLGLVCSAAALGAQPKESTPPAQQTPANEPAPTITETLRREARAVRPLVKTDAARAFLDATARLPEPKPRTVWRNREKGVAFSQAEYDALSAREREGLTKRDCSPEFYYTTGYGTPLMYARPLDLLAERAGINSWSGLRICDFGYGTIGHARLLASCGADFTGVDVEPLFRALYSEPGDLGSTPGTPDSAGKSHDGSITLATGRWPAEPAVKDRVGTGYDLFISKNTLKRGYIHPARAVDEKFLVKLGVDDKTFCREVFAALKPGGWFLIYNLSPAQNPDDKPYLPHADGQCPFPRELLERTGFQVLAYDQSDRDAALDFWMALGINDGKSRDDAAKDLFAWWTLSRKPG